MVIGGADYQSGMIHVVDKQNKICPMADKSMFVWAGAVGRDCGRQPRA